MKLKLIPLTITRANEVVDEWHRHCDPVEGARFALGAEFEGELVGVVLVGRPVARKLDHHFTAEVNRLCTLDTAPKNTGSFLYGAARRVWFSMGGTRLLTYTLKKESGDSLRGAGWIITGEVIPRGKGWESRDREHQEIFGEEKLRWEAPVLHSSCLEVASVGKTTGRLIDACPICGRAPVSFVHDLRMCSCGHSWKL